MCYGITLRLFHMQYQSFRPLRLSADQRSSVEKFPYFWSVPSREVSSVNTAETSDPSGSILTIFDRMIRTSHPRRTWVTSELAVGVGSSRLLGREALRLELTAKYG